MPLNFMTDTEHLKNRHIRSYVLRQGRVTVAQQRAVDTLQPRFGIPYTAQAVDLNEAFGRTAPKILEIGFGMGDSTATIAADNPANDYLCLEVHTPGVGNLFKVMDEKQLTNIRIIQHDAVEVLRDMIADASLDGVHIFFPDPGNLPRKSCSASPGRKVPVGLLGLAMKISFAPCSTAACRIASRS